MTNCWLGQYCSPRQNRADCRRLGSIAAVQFVEATADPSLRYAQGRANRIHSSNGREVYSTECRGRRQSAHSTFWVRKRGCMAACNPLLMWKGASGPNRSSPWKMHGRWVHRSYPRIQILQRDLVFSLVAPVRHILIREHQIVFPSVCHRFGVLGYHLQPRLQHPGPSFEFLPGYCSIRCLGDRPHEQGYPVPASPPPPPCPGYC